MMSNSLWPILGGTLIGLSSVLLMLLVGKVAGISGITWRLVSPLSSEKLYSGLFIIGLILGTYAFHSISGFEYPQVNANYPLAAIAGILVGVGVKLGNGCTSGHGVCGIGRLSLRSIVATLIFMFIAVVTVLLTGVLA